MKSLFAIASLRQLRWPSVQTANVQRRQKHFWVIVSLLGSIHHVQNKGAVHELDGFVERLLIGVNITCNFSYVKAKTPSLSAITRKQPSDMCSFFSCRHRWWFTVLCWPHAHNYKNFICHQKSSNWIWLFFLYKASFLLPAQTSLRSLSPGCRCLWGVVV